MNPQDQAMEKAMEILGEHFDVVRVFGVLSDDAEKESRIFSQGCGNRYAQEGAVRTWLNMEEEYDREKARIRAQTDNEDDNTD